MHAGSKQAAAQHPIINNKALHNLLNCCKPAAQHPPWLPPSRPGASTRPSRAPAPRPSSSSRAGRGRHGRQGHARGRRRAHGRRRHRRRPASARRHHGGRCHDHRLAGRRRRFAGRRRPCWRADAERDCWLQLGAVCKGAEGCGRRAGRRRPPPQVLVGALDWMARCLPLCGLSGRAWGSPGLQPSGRAPPRQNDHARSAAIAVPGRLPSGSSPRGGAGGGALARPVAFRRAQPAAGPARTCRHRHVHRVHAQTSRRAA